MNVGDRITVRQLHADGVCYRWHAATLESIETDCIVAVLHKGELITQVTGNWVLPENVRMFFWPGQWVILEESYDEQGTFKEIYININAPPIVGATMIEYVDYELDVAKERDKPAVILDEDEFAEAILIYGYSESHQQKCWAAVRAGLALAENWQPCGWQPQ